MFEALVGEDSSLGQASLVMAVMAAIVFCGLFAVGNPVDADQPRGRPGRTERNDPPPCARHAGACAVRLFLAGSAQGDLGTFFVRNRPAMELILSRLPATLELAFPGILIPVVTVLGLETGNVIAFAVVTETVFSWPGIGKLPFDSFGLLERPVVAADLKLTVFLFVMNNLVVDIGYSLLDPRVWWERRPVMTADTPPSRFVVDCLGSLLAVIAGMGLGLLADARGGWVETLIMPIVDIQLSFLAQLARRPYVCPIPDDVGPPLVG